MRLRRAASIALAAVCVAGATSGSGTADTAAVPVLVELFTAEGCSSCPPADALLGGLIANQPAAGAVLVGLGEHVDYWDHLGWKDRFSSGALTARQRLYADHLKLDTYTPQMIVDGVAAFVGSDLAAARRAIEQAQAAPHGVLRVQLAAISDREMAVSVAGSGMPPLDAGDHAEAVVAITEDDLRSDVKRGENAGKALSHAAVVRAMTSLGDLDAAGAPVRGRLAIGRDWNRSQLKIVAFAQARRSRRVLATANTERVP
jgi:hypothetical protein